MEGSEVRRLRMQYRFTNLLNAKETKANGALMTNDRYLELIKDVKHAKSCKKKVPRDYWLLHRYDVVTIQDIEKLIKPMKVFNYAEVVFYVKKDDLFDVLYDVHLQTGHKGRDTMVKVIRRKYKNVTQEQILIFLETCEVCQRKKSEKKRASGKIVKFHPCNRINLMSSSSHELDSGPELTTIQKSEDDGELETKFDIADLVNIDHEFTSGDPLAEKTGEDDHHDFQENSRNTIPSAENAMSQQQNKTVISTVTKNSGGIVRKRATAAISTNPKRTKIDTLHSASKDALDLFFDGIKSTMRQFSATDIHQVKAKIFSIVSEVEAKYLDVPEMQTADDFELVKVKEELSDYHVQFCDEEEEERNSSVMEERMIKKEVNNIVSNDPLYMGESSGSGKGKVEEDASNKKVVRKTAFCPVWNCCEDNCSVRFSTERQLQMNTEFQNFTSEEKDAYICSLVLVIGDDCKIERTRVYRLPDSFDGSNVDVCKKMFRSVLNLTNKSITNALSKKSWGEYEFHDTLLAEARARQIVLNRKFQI
ncbi:PREDICTED: uncharacterized protein LOC108559909 isoform X2 [Nicrophorus vespilloides]|uniref:Uncharacterized protein LOC108559909 isoform X2 n=1 Tax=Nicrophorus vespilloides TaxID=110193 RepID=A0ABM1MDX9_NICVS|nr:PREDICTED: uncharacterized protein LOC108559909 isoform X2 [Nicrophorus vespilloides]